MVRRVFLLLLAASVVITLSAQMNRNADNQNDMKKRQIEGEITKSEGRIQTITSNEARYKQEMTKLDNDIPPGWYVEQDRVALQREYDQLKRDQRTLDTEKAHVKESNYNTKNGYLIRLGQLSGQQMQLTQRQSTLDQKLRDLDKKVAAGKKHKAKKDELVRKLDSERTEKKQLELKVDNWKRELGSLSKG